MAVLSSSKPGGVLVDMQVSSKKNCIKNAIRPLVTNKQGLVNIDMITTLKDSDFFIENLSFNITFIYIPFKFSLFTIQLHTFSLCFFTTGNMILLVGVRAGFEVQVMNGGIFTISMLLGCYYSATLQLQKSHNTGHQARLIKLHVYDANRKVLPPSISQTVSKHGNFNLWSV